MYIARIEKEVGQYYVDVKETVADLLNNPNQPLGRNEDVVESYKKALEEKDKLIAELQNTSSILKAEFESEKKRVRERVDRLVSEIDFLEKSKAKKEAIGNYDLRNMQLKLDELQSKIGNCKHKSSGGEANLNHMKMLESINAKLEAIARNGKNNNQSWQEKQLEVR